MENREHIERLKQSVQEWNQWRREHPEVQPNLVRADLNYTNLSYANLNDVNLRHADLSRATLSHADLSRVDLSRVDLSGADLRQANLNDANLSYANLSYANLRQADFCGAILRHADLSSTDLRQADLSGASLFRTNLSSAQLGEADFSQTHFAHTILAWTDLSEVSGLQTAFHDRPSVVDLNSVILPDNEQVRRDFLYDVGWTSIQIEYLPSLLTSRPIQYHSLFISYASQDDAIAKRLHNDLRKSNVPCWFAPHDLCPGTPILRGLEEAIHWSDKFLLILSKHAVNSRWIEREVDAALHQEIKRGQDILFPIRLDNAVLESNAGWATRLQHRHIGDFTNWKQHDTAYQHAFSTLLRHLRVAKPPTV